MEKRLDLIRIEALSALEPVDDEKSLENWQVKYLGRSSELMEIFKALGTLSKEEKPVVGRTANQVKVALETASGEKENLINQRRINQALEGEKIDVTLPGRRTISGSIHPTTQTLREIYRVFGDMGFQIYRSREVETDEFNFQLLNFPPHHPARICRILSLSPVIRTAETIRLYSERILLRGRFMPCWNTLRSIPRIHPRLG